MRIVQVCGTYSPSRCGVAHYTARLAESLAACGEDVALAGRPGSGNSPVTFLPIRTREWSLPAVMELLKLAFQWRADWLHLQYAPGSFDHRRIVTVLPLLARSWPGGPKVAVTLHEYGGWPLHALPPFARITDAAFQIAERSGWGDRESLALMSLSHLAIVTNQDHFTTVRERSTQLASRLRIIPIGPNVGPDTIPAVQRTEARVALGVASDTRVAVFFGFVHPVKGVETLLSAFRRARQQYPRLRLWIVGGVESLALRGEEATDYEQKIRGQIAEQDLDDVVDMTGFVSDAEAALRLRAADIAVLPFNHGVTFKSGTLITCLSMGLPVLATYGGYLGSLQHGKSIWLVPPKDPTALSDAMVLLAAEPEVRARIAREGAALSQNFRWPVIAQQHGSAYHAAGLTLLHRLSTPSATVSKVEPSGEWWERF